MGNRYQGGYAEHLSGALFLRAQRLHDGERTFRLTEGEPLATSFGEDIYRQIFAGKHAEPRPAALTVVTAVTLTSPCK
jgi:hypothetical protein